MASDAFAVSHKKRENKVIPLMRGGLGNQLFIYAAARRLALVNRAELVIDSVSGFARDNTYKRHYQLDRFNINARKATPQERLEPLGRVRRYLLRNVSRLIPFDKRVYVSQERLEYDRRLLELRTQGTVYLDGYWQGYEYFQDIATVIRQDLTIDPPIDERNSIMAKRIRNSVAVAVHVRFFDVAAEASCNNVPSDYYAKAIAEVESRVRSAHYFIFSDQPVLARAIIPLPDSRVTFVDHNCGDENATSDLWLMAICHHHIIANSTFSWWGAWLGVESDKIVVAPALQISGRRYKTSWGYPGLLPSNWIKI